MLTMLQFDALVSELLRLGFDEEAASRHAARIGDTPETDEQGRVVIRDEAGRILVRLPPWQ